MIQSEKDRMECLRLAVQLLMPKSAQMTDGKAATMVVDAAKQFYAFVTEGEKK